MPKKSPNHLRNKSIAVIGLGQIGGSIVKRLSPLRPAITLLAHDRDRRLASKAARYATWITDLKQLVAQSDLIILAVPVPAIIALLDQIAELREPRRSRPLVMDTGTVKHLIQQAALKHKSRFDYIGLHPLAGSEGEGWKSSRPDLFEGRTIICTNASAVRRPQTRELISILGASMTTMAARMHDRLVAEAIGLPHILAFAAQGMSSSNPLRAGSWASLTRVAASNPEMVAAFLSTNASEQNKAIARFEKELARLKRALADRSGRALAKLLADRQRTQE